MSRPGAGIDCRICFSGRIRHASGRVSSTDDCIFAPRARLDFFKTSWEFPVEMVAFAVTNAEYRHRHRRYHRAVAEMRCRISALPAGPHSSFGASRA